MEGDFSNKTGLVVFPNGNRIWFLNGQRHSLDEPAESWPDGTQYWYKHGLLDRNNAPAILLADGSQFWYKEGKLFREPGENGEELPYYLNKKTMEMRFENKHTNMTDADYEKYRYRYDTKRIKPAR